MFIVTVFANKNIKHRMMLVMCVGYFMPILCGIVY